MVITLLNASTTTPGPVWSSFPVVTGFFYGALHAG